MIIALGTENIAKVSAVKEIINLAFPDELHDIMTHTVESGVRDQPLNDDETIQGALNRAHAAVAKTPDADIAIGLEGGVQDTEVGMFLRGWVVVIDITSAHTYYGHSGGMCLPEAVAKRLRNGEELGPLIQSLHPEIKPNIRHTIGTGGLITDGLYVRQREFEDALRCALGSLRADQK